MSKADYKPKQLPFLPGNVYSDPYKTKHHKTQILNVKDGANLEKTKSDGIQVDEALITKI